MEVIVSLTTGNRINWFAVRVKSNRERVTSLGLTGKGYEVFLPECVRGMSTARGNPLFPGYLFCRFDVNRRLPVLTVPGVVHIVGVGKTPLPISEDEIGSLRVVVSASLPIKTDEVYTVGDKVQIDKGPLVGASGVVVGCQRKKLIVSITLLQRSVSVELPQDWIGQQKN
jgi:transcription termination/antitermination protein NusG